MTELTGKCFCGEVTFHATGEVEGGAICYCESCQIISGGGPNYVLRLSNFDVITKGDPQSFEHPGGSGKLIKKWFCSNCGTHL